MYSQFRLTVCIGSATQSSLQSWLGPSAPPTCVVANGIDPTRFRPQNAAAKLPDAVNGAATILCVGSLTDRKNQETLVRAVAEVGGVHILLAGDGPLRPALEGVALELGVDDRVHFLGIRNDIPELIAAAQLYVQPSKIDGFCLAALEAMAGGLPVVASDIPGLRDVVGDAGVLFPAGDHRRLAECIRRILSDFALRKKLSDRGIDRAQEFSVDKTAAEYQKIFETVTERAVLSTQHEFTS
jgi:glycosyltransferase involved in cell wall biosynthesis